MSNERTTGEVMADLERISREHPEVVKRWMFEQGQLLSRSAATRWRVYVRGAGTGAPIPAATFREVPPASPLAALKGDPYANYQRCPRCNAPNTACLGPNAAKCQECGASMYEPLAALKGATERAEAAAVPGSDWRPLSPGEELAPGALDLYARGIATVTTDDVALPPTPAAMLGEALELMERARMLALDAFDQMPETMLSRTNGVVRFGDARQWVEWLKREAEAKNGR